MKWVWILFFLFLLSPAFAEKAIPFTENPPPARPTARIRKLNSWNIRVSAKELDLRTVLSGNILLTLYGPLVGNTLFVSRQCEPFSLSSARQKVREWGGDERTLRIYKKAEFLSYMPKKAKGARWDTLIWVATNGDCLIANTDHLSKKKYLSLRNRVSRGDD